MKYLLRCENCSHKIYTDGKDLQGLIEIPTAAIPKRGSGTDKETVSQKKKIKCPKCGYILRIIKLEAAKEEPKQEETPEPKLW